MMERDMPRTDSPNDETKWQSRLAGEVVETFADEPDYGFYRVLQGRNFVPVAYWYNEETGDLRCKVNNRLLVRNNPETGQPEHDDMSAREMWPRASKNPITKEEYDRVIRGEQTWSDMDPTVAAQVARPNGNPREHIGANNPPTDPVDQLREQIESAQKSASLYAEINDDVTLGAARSLHARLLELRGSAVKQHRAEKEPHLREGQKIDKKWFGLRDLAAEAARKVNDAMDAFANRKLKALRAEEARQAAEAAKQAAEAAAAVQEFAPDAAPAPTEPAPPLAPATPTNGRQYAAPRPAPVIAPVKGAYGRAASVGVVHVITEITDWDALYAAFKDRDEIKVALRKLAEQAVKNGQTVPGVVTEEQAKVRG
jgi:hypothetical protein